MSSRREDGFTLIEVLVVVLVIGVLAAIALPTFLGQRVKGDDAAAKSDARNVAGVVEACNTDKQDYTGCTNATLLQPNAAGVTFGSGRGEVEVDAPSSDEYTVTAHSRSGTDFVFSRDSGGQHRTCTRSGHGACDGSGRW